MYLGATAEILLDLRVVVDACYSNHLRHTCFMLLSFNYISVQDTKQACKGCSVTVQTCQHYGAT